MTDRRQNVVVITGASAGVGRAAVREFAKRGASIGLIARGKDGLEAARREVEALGCQALNCELDVSDAEQVARAATAIEEALGPIDVWVNNAMVSVFSPVKQTSAAEFRRVTEVNYLGYVHGTLVALERMLLRNHGVIIQVGSALAYRGIPLQAAYCGSKHAIRGFTESLRAELLHDKSGVRITEVDLPAMNTPQFGWVRSRLPRKPQPVPPIFQPEFAARQIYRAAQDHPATLLVGLPTTLTVLANSIAPTLVDRYLAKTGYESQQTKEPAMANREDNLFAPVPGDHGAHGTFDGGASSQSLVLSGSTAGWAVPLASSLGGALAAFTGQRFARKLRKSQRR